MVDYIAPAEVAVPLRVPLAIRAARPAPAARAPPGSGAARRAWPGNGGGAWACCQGWSGLHTPCWREWRPMCAPRRRSEMSMAHQHRSGSPEGARAVGIPELVGSVHVARENTAESRTSLQAVRPTVGMRGVGRCAPSWCCRTAQTSGVPRRSRFRAGVEHLGSPWPSRLRWAGQQRHLPRLAGKTRGVRR